MRAARWPARRRSAQPVSIRWRARRPSPSTTSCASRAPWRTVRLALARARRCLAHARGKRWQALDVAALDQLDLVAVRILHERDHRRAALDRPRLARDRAARGADPVARGVNVIDADGQVAIGRPQVVLVD